WWSRLDVAVAVAGAAVVVGVVIAAVALRHGIGGLGRRCGGRGGWGAGRGGGPPGVGVVVRRRARRWGRGLLLPQFAPCVEGGALGLAGGGVREVGVEGMPVVGGLDRAVWPLDRAQRAGDPGPGGGGAGDRRPEVGAAPVALGDIRGVGGERVEGEALGIGQHGGAVNRGGFQRAAGGGHAGGGSRGP